MFWAQILFFVKLYLLWAQSKFSIMTNLKLYTAHKTGFNSLAVFRWFVKEAAKQTYSLAVFAF